MFGALCSLLGVGPEAIRLLFSIFAAIPISHIYRLHIYQRSAREQQLFLFLTGLALHVFNFGADTIHALIGTLVCWLLLQVAGGTPDSAWIAHVVFLGHLLWGYVISATEHYDITWTTPYCLMTLRYIGLIVDVADGAQKEKLKPALAKEAINDPPDLLEIAAFGFCYSYTLVGPLCSLHRFRNWIGGDHLDEKKEFRESSITAATQSLTAGLCYVVFHLVGAAWLPDEYLSTKEFYEHSFMTRWSMFALWARILLSRYVSAFLLAEAATIYSGLGWSGKDKKTGEEKWDACRCVDVWLWETGSDFNALVQSFNRQTNLWMKKHVFRRLIWLGDKRLSHGLTLLYLAIWHGFHGGYFLLFGFEYFAVRAQNEFYALIERNPEIKSFLYQESLAPFRMAAGRIVVLYTMGYGILPFGLVTFRNWIRPLASLYFVPYILYCVALPAIFSALKPPKASGVKDPNDNDSNQKTMKSISEKSFAQSLSSPTSSKTTSSVISTKTARPAN
ncbi:unnamed protein product, partial [Mesorhabditis spiculigera]